MRPHLIYERTRRAMRGSALPETAIVVSFILVMVFGTLQMGVVGGLQLMVDGAAFVAAHEFSLNYTKTTAQNQQTVSTLFPQVNVLPITIASNAPTVLPSNVPLVTVTYPASQTAREGGTSLIRRSNLQATVDATGPVGALGAFLAGAKIFGVHGSAIEPLSWQGNPQYDVANAGYTSVTPKQSAFFGSAQDVPYSYVSMQRMSMCLQGGSLNNAPIFATTCDAKTGVEISALGSAEFLDQDNWGRTNLGAGPFGSSPGAANTYPNAYTFSEMFCHQQMYANVAANIFVAVTTNAGLITGPGAQNTFDLVYPNKKAKDADSTLAAIYAWDRPVVNPSPAPTPNLTPYTTSSQYGTTALNPGGGCS